MALYENGKRISGIRDFPAYTWAEYHALPVAKRPRIWNCTDRDYTEIPPENVPLTKQSTAIDATALSAKSKAGNLHFFGYFHNNATINNGTVIYTFADHLPSVAQTILALNTNGGVASVTIYEDGRVYVASTMAVGYWVLIGEVWE